MIPPPNGGSVVAPTSTIVPASTWGSRASCWALRVAVDLVEEDDGRGAPEGRLVARRADDVAQRRDPVHRRVERLEARPDRLREEPADRRLARSRAAPREASTGRRPPSTSRRSGAPGPSRWAWPTTSSSAAGRIRAARGVSSAGGAKSGSGARPAGRRAGTPRWYARRGGAARARAVASGSRSRSRSPRGPRGASTASGRRSKVATRRTPSRSAAATSRASESRGRCSAATRSRAAARSRSPSVGATTRTAPDVHDATRARDAAGPELALEDVVRLGERQGADQERLVHGGEPGARRRVVEIGGVGRREDRRRVEQDRHRSSLPRLAGRRRAPSSRPAMRRASSESRPWALRPIPTKGRSGGAACASRYASRAAAMTAVLVVRARRASRSTRSRRSGSARIVVRLRGAICSHIYHAGRTDRPPLPCPNRTRAPTAPPRPQEAEPVPRFEQNLRIPGPTALPPTVMAAGGRQMINHRGPEFAALMERVVRRMRPFFGTGAGHRPAHRGRHRRPRGRRRQRPLARRPGPRRHRRGLRRPLREGGRGLRGRRPPPRGRVGPRRHAGRSSSGAPRGAVREGRPADPQRDVDRGHQPDSRAGRRGPRGRPRRPHPRRRDQRSRRRSLRDGRLGPGPRRHRLPEGLDVRPRDGLRRRRRAGVGGDGDGADAALLLRPAARPRERAHRPDALDAGRRRPLPGRRGPPPHGGGDAGGRLRPPRRLRRRRPRGPGRPSASPSSPTRPTPRRPSLRPGFPTTSTGRPSTARSRSGASSSPAARGSSRDGSSGSATSGPSRSRRSSARSP